MVSVTLICLGRLKESYLREACAEYEKRMGSLCRLSILELSPCKLPEKPSQAEIENALEAEAKLIISKLPKGARVYTLCIEGKQLTSEQLSAEIEGCAVNGNGSLAFVIGSSYGLSERVKQLSTLRLSMSKMTFPHQLARVMLLEQLYRAFQISLGSRYHK